MTGFVVDNAVSYWTKDSAPYWEQLKYSEEKPPRHKSDKPDGPIVEKGAAAQRLRESYATDQSARKLYTCIGCAKDDPLSDSPFDTSNTGLTADIIDWVRGQDNKDNENNCFFDVNINKCSTDPNKDPFTDVRSSIHGDVLHSRPAVVNYNRDGTNNDIMVYYGANDGIFHAVKGGQGSCAVPGNCDGEEKWGFVAEEFFSQLKRLREQTPLICSNDPGPDSTNACVIKPGAAPKPYFFDGSVGVLYQEDG